LEKRSEAVLFRTLLVVVCGGVVVSAAILDLRFSFSVLFGEDRPRLTAPEFLFAFSAPLLVLPFAFAAMMLSIKCLDVRRLKLRLSFAAIVLCILIYELLHIFEFI
jgi:hypothetical protein